MPAIESFLPSPSDIVSPSSPSLPRRLSIGSIQSPVAVANRSINFTKFEEAVEDVKYFAEHHQQMCSRAGKSGINEDYANRYLLTSDIWRVDDGRGKLFGFALTKDHVNRTPPEIEIRLICVKQNKGEGGTLFRNILNHAEERGMELVLEAINAKVAHQYAKHAIGLGFEVETNDSQYPGMGLDEYIQMQSDKGYNPNMLLRFRSPLGQFNDLILN